MSNFKEASKQKLRFDTAKGALSVEQLWDLSISELDQLAVALESEYKESGKKSFLVKSSAKDKKKKLQFDVALEILTEKVEEKEAATEAREAKEYNQKIMSLIAEKQDDELRNLSLKQLEAKLK